MTMSRDLFLSILAMDAYNRGYDAGIDGLGESGSIGNATLKPRAALGITPLEYQDWQTASFYGQAYTLDASVGGVPGGTTIISFRGTDAPFAGDIAAWTGGAGFQTIQARMAAQHA